MIDLAVVTGARDWKDDAAIYSVLEALEPALIMHGDQSGADTFAGMWARAHGRVEIKVPYVGKLGRAGGPVRNMAMVSFAEAYRRMGFTVSCHAFHTDLKRSRGTTNMVNSLRRAGLIVELHS